VTQPTTTTVPVLMPKLSDSMEEAVILAWLKRPGERVERGEALVEVETDKATIVYESELAGTLEEILVDEGSAALLGAPIATLVTHDEVPKGAHTAARSEVREQTPTNVVAETASEPEPPASAGRPDASGRARATPVARRTAVKMGVKLTDVRGTGPAGRITRRDVLGHGKNETEPPTTAAKDVRIALSPTQRTIARRMAESRATIPEFTISSEVDMTGALRLRAELNELHPSTRISVNDLIIKAASIALREFPNLNSSYDGDQVIRRGRVNIGIAVDAGEALLVPVIDDVDRKSLDEIAAEARAAVERARNRSVSLEEVAGGTFTVSNLGMLGVLSFTAVINPPQAAILAVGAVQPRPTFTSDGRVAPFDAMQLNLSCDHRIVYGAEAARFLGRIGELLTSPITLLVPRELSQRGET
jgi:pyruvate dehydrogenase E2 component (dihydrolipoamide acetyltransferase)